MGTLFGGPYNEDYSFFVADIGWVPCFFPKVGLAWALELGLVPWSFGPVDPGPPVPWSRGPRPSRLFGPWSLAPGSALLIPWSLACRVARLAHAMHAKIFKNGNRAKALAWRVLTFSSSNHAVDTFRFQTSSRVERAHISLVKSSSHGAWPHFDFKRALSCGASAHLDSRNALSRGASSHFASQIVPWPHVNFKLALSRGASSHLDSRNELSRGTSSHFASQIVPLWRVLTLRFQRRSSLVERAHISLVKSRSRVKRPQI